ncbi:MAG TPA: alpha/beta hydrolase [Thermoanaerobaculia bacterium]|nr:alpha/beta hydrolase [Thermoanaerobaculia bacterium]
MDTRSAASALSALILVVVSGDAEGQAKKADDMADRVNRPVVYSVEGMDRVRVRKDLVYKKDGGTELKMDISTPEALKPGELLPAVFFLHGGIPADVPVKPKDWGIYRSWGRLIAASGLAAVTFNHRVGFPDPNLAQGAADVADAIAFVRDRAAEFGIDRDRIALAAYSAGGPLLAAPIREPQPYVRCLVAFYAFLDLRPSELHRKFLSDEQVRKFSPAVAISETKGKIPPIFVARAGKDQIPDLLPGLDRFVSEALARNAPLVFFNQPDGEHGFDNQPGDPRSREIVREAVEFLKRNLTRP